MTSLRWIATTLLLGAVLACNTSTQEDAVAPPSSPPLEVDEEDPLDGTEIPDDTPDLQDDADAGADADGGSGTTAPLSDAGADGGSGTTAPLPERGVGIDADGVVMLKATKVGGASFRLGAANPNSVSRFEIEQGTTAVSRTEGGLRFWNVAGHPVNYASGGTGYTSRLHVYATGTTQRYTWRNTPGYLGVSADLKNQEYTVYARAHTITDTARAAFSMKVRGGRHSSSNGDLASCTMTVIRPGGRPRFSKELTHPTYDNVALRAKSAATLTNNAWLGLKLVTYQQDATHVVYRMYVDSTPFAANGKPANRYFLFAEYVDVANKSTGKYSKLANWGGMLTTFRADGMRSVDFAIVSVREIVP